LDPAAVGHPRTDMLGWMAMDTPLNAPSVDAGEGDESRYV